MLYTKTVNYFLLMLCVCLLSPPVHAGAASDKLQEFFEQVDALQADFEQTVSNDQTAQEEHAAGVLVMSRPGKFRWDYTEPYKQLIVADGDKVWIYDMDLEQITVKPQDAILGSTPAALLSGNEPIEGNFVITELDRSEGLDWVELLPPTPDGSFESVRLGFGARNLEIMELYDNFGQTTRLRFSNLKRNPELSADIFSFTPPEGVDVIGQ